MPTATDNQLPIAYQKLPAFCFARQASTPHDGARHVSQTCRQHAALYMPVFGTMSIIFCHPNDEFLPLLTLQESICITLAAVLHFTYWLPCCDFTCLLLLWGMLHPVAFSVPNWTLTRLLCWILASLNGKPILLIYLQKGGLCESRCTSALSCNEHV